MSPNPIISIVCPPFPSFIESNKTSYSPGQVHPNRSRLPYFDLIFVIRGALFLTEDGIPYEVKEGEMFILCPLRHHFTTKPCEEDTDFYWLHFFYDGVWAEDDEPLNLHSNVPIPNLHYHSEDYSIHLRKHMKVSNISYIIESLHKLWQNTTHQSTATAFWDNQLLFAQLLRYLEESGNSKSTTIMLAQQIELYIKQHYRETITNEVLSNEFHFHENHLIRCMKKVFELTPLEYLFNYRLEKAATHLIRTDRSVAEIAADVGFQTAAYFSLCFKKKYDLSPLNYRKLHTSVM